MPVWTVQRTVTVFQATDHLKNPGCRSKKLIRLTSSGQWCAPRSHWALSDPAGLADDSYHVEPWFQSQDRRPCCWCQRVNVDSWAFAYGCPPRPDLSAASRCLQPVVDIDGGPFLGQSPSLAVALVGAGLIGLTVGAEIDLLAYITSRYFGLRSFGNLFGVIYACFRTTLADFCGSFVAIVYGSACLMAGKVGCGGGLDLLFFRPTALRRRACRKANAIMLMRACRCRPCHDRPSK